MGLRPPPRDLALLVAVPVVWGLNFIPIRWALDEVPPLALSSLRFLLAAVPLVFFVRRPAARPAVVVSYGLAIGVFQFGLLFLAIHGGLPAGLASLLMQMQMFFTVGLAAIFAGDRITGRHAAGGAICLAGLGLLALGMLGAGATVAPWVLALVLGASLSWAAGNVLAKRASRRRPFDMFGLVVWSSLVAPLPLAILSFAFEGGWAPLEAVRHAGWRTWLSVLAMAYVATLFGYAAWNRLLQKYPAGLVSPFTMIVPLAGLAGGFLVLGERLALDQVLAAAVVLAGIVVAAWPGRGSGVTAGPGAQAAAPGPGAP